LSGKAYIKVKVMFKFIVSFLLLLISFNVKSQDNLENINVLEEVIKIVDSQEQIFYLKKIKGLKKSDRLFLRIANGRFYIKENEVEDFSGNISKEGRKLDSLILSKKEIEKLLLNLKKQTVWEDNLFENSTGLEDRNDKYKKNNKSKYIFVFTKPIYIRNNSICFVSYAAICGGDCGVFESAFFIKEKTKWKKWIIISGGEF
jgi:competence protein ComGC